MWRAGFALLASGLGAVCVGQVPGLTESRRAGLQLPTVWVFDVAGQEFARWDADKDGVVTEKELDAVILDPQVKGVRAAVKNFAMGEALSGRPVEVTFEFVQSQAFATRRAAVAEVVGKPILDGEGNVVGHWRQWMPSGQLLFDLGRRALMVPTPELYGIEGTGPDFKTLSQGFIGDCYFIALLGAKVHAEAGAVAKMISADPANARAFMVSWGDGVKTAVPAMTDGELALGGGSMRGGLWVRVFEKALAIRLGKAAGTGEGVVAPEVIGKGGNPSRVIPLFTGHTCAVQPLLGRRSASLGEDSVAKEAATLRASLGEAMKMKRVVELATSAAGRLPPGMDRRHAYAVVGYDEGTDVVSVWNPHGLSFSPAGTAGLVNGYAMQNGIFQMPLRDAVALFEVAFVETGEAKEGRSVSGQEGK